MPFAVFHGVNATQDRGHPPLPHHTVAVLIVHQAQKWVLRYANMAQMAELTPFGVHDPCGVSIKKHLRQK